MIIFMYKVLAWVGTPFLKVYIKNRLKKGKEDALRFRERYGIASRYRPDGPLVWCHGASVGESMSLLPIVTALCQKGVSVLVTTGTVTSAQIMMKNLPESVAHQYIPADNPLWVASFLDYWKPTLGVFVESELWPNLISGCSRRKIPLILANAQLSDRSFRRWKYISRTAKKLLSSFSVILAQSSTIADRFLKLGAMDARVAGNLKFAVAKLSYSSSDLMALKESIGNRPVWVAASTHPGEEELILKTHQLIKGSIPDVLTILIPRHPDRAGEIRTLLELHQVKISQRSHQEMPKKGDEIYLADTMGEMGVFYRLCPFSFIGGTFVPIGGHNPIEPIKLKSYVFWGPYQQNCDEISAVFGESLTTVQTPQQLADKLIHGFKKPDTYREKLTEAYKIVEDQQNSLHDLMDVISFFLTPVPKQNPTPFCEDML